MTRTRTRRLICLISVALTAAALLAGDLPGGATSPAAPHAAVTATGAAPSRVLADCTAPNVTCITSDRSEPLEITGNDRIYEGLGHRVPGITATGDNITIQGFVSSGAASTGIWIKGRNPVVQDNTIQQVHFNGDDIDGIRFFGDGALILNNKETNILAGKSHGAHLDCIQTFASPNTGASSDVLIQGNDCRDRNFHQGLMAEGPKSTDGGGGAPGDSRNWVIRGNYFQCYANQTVALRAIHDVLVDSNTFAGAGSKGVQLADGSTVTIKNNILGSGYRTLFGD